MKEVTYKITVLGKNEIFDLVELTKADNIIKETKQGKYIVLKDRQGYLQKIEGN